MIYFIREGEYPDTRVKIGYTVSEDVSKRLSTLQTGNAGELVEAWKIPGDKEVEGLIHRFFKQFRIRGEWFREDCWYDILFAYFTENIRGVVENYTTPADDSEGRNWDNNDDGDECIPEIKHWLRSEVSV